MPPPDTRPVILLVFANDRRPGGTWLRALGRELRDIQQVLRPLTRTGECVVVPLTSATHTTLLRGIADHRARIVGVHFGGHADPGGLHLEDEDGNPTPLRVAGLTAALGDAEALRWIFLNGCGTEEHVAALRALRAPIVATDRAVKDDLARHFAVAFYDALVGGHTLAGAFAEAETEGPTRHATAADALRAEAVADGIETPDLRMLRPARVAEGDDWPWVMALPDDRADAADWRLLKTERRRQWPAVLALAALALAVMVALTVAVWGPPGAGSQGDAGGVAPTASGPPDERGARPIADGAVLTSGKATRQDVGPRDGGPRDAASVQDVAHADEGRAAPVTKRTAARRDPPRRRTAPRVRQAPSACPSDEVDGIVALFDTGRCRAATRRVATLTLGSDCARRSDLTTTLGEAARRCEARCGPTGLRDAREQARALYRPACRTAWSKVNARCPEDPEAISEQTCTFYCGDGRKTHEEECDPADPIGERCSPTCTRVVQRP